MNTGKLYIISAPSGAGKTSLVKRLMTELPELVVSISHTTRAMRPGEIDGKDYYFIDLNQFQTMVQNQDFLEYAQVFDNFYGTAKATVLTNLSKGLDVILEIDWQGAQQIRDMLPDSLSIFILPPSTTILQQRLKGRGQDSEEIIERRMRDAVTEMRHYAEFNYLIVNDDFELALFELKSIISANRLLQSRQQQKLNDLLQDLIQE